MERFQLSPVDRCRAKFMTSCEIRYYRGCAHALVMRMIAVGSYILQLTRQ